MVVPIFPIGTVDVNAATAKMRLVQIAEDIISVLAGDSQANVKVSVKITADFPEGVSDQIKRTVSENATNQGKADFADYPIGKQVIFPIAF